MKKKHFRIILITSIMFSLLALSAAGVYAAAPTVKVTKEGSAYRVSYSGEASSKGKLINVFAYRGDLNTEKNGASIRDENFLDGDTAVIGADGRCSVDLKIDADDGAVVYIGAKDDLLPGGKSPYLVPASILAVPKLTGTLTRLSPGPRTYDQVWVNWNRVDRADGYYIFRTYDPGSWSAAPSMTITGGDVLTYLDSQIATGMPVYYRVQAYRYTDEGKIATGPVSLPSYTVTYLKGTSLRSVKAKKKTATIKWSAVDGASGYYIYRAAKKNKGYKKIKVVKGAGKVSFTNKGLKKKTKYFYKIRAYRTVGGRTVFAPYSNVKSVRIK